MPSWTELIQDIDSHPDSEKREWLVNKLNTSLNLISFLRSNRNVILYGSSFLQKPLVPPGLIQITLEEINGFMSIIHSMNCSRGLTLILHTPGGVTNATETIVSYLRSKFKEIEVIIPTYAMSAGSMISLSADRIIMGRQSQLGPIDPQMPVNNRFVSAIAVIDQFESAKKDIISNTHLAHLWAPILASLGPALLQEAQNSIDYSEKIVAGWLCKYMFKGLDDSRSQGLKVAKHFSRGANNGDRKISHGRRIDREEARSQGVKIIDLEDSQELQEAVLTTYHIMTIFFEKSAATKFMWSSLGKAWMKNFQPPGKNVQAEKDDNRPD